MIKTLQEILSTANHEDALMLRGIGDADLERCTINGAAREAEFHVRGSHGEASTYRMTDLRFSRVASWGYSAVILDIYLFPLRDRAVSRGVPPAARLDVLFDGDSPWSRSENEAEAFRQENLDAYYLEVGACYGGVYAFAFGDMTLEQHIPDD